MIDGLATPINAKGIAKLLGHVGWYRELIPDFAKIAVPITHLLKKDSEFVWRSLPVGFRGVEGKIEYLPGTKAT